MTYLIITHFDDGEFIQESYETFDTLEEAIELAKSECMNRFTSVSIFSGEYVEWGEQEWIETKEEEERQKRKAEQKAKQKNIERQEMAIYKKLKQKYEKGGD